MATPAQIILIIAFAVFLADGKFSITDKKTQKVTSTPDTELQVREKMKTSDTNRAVPDTKNHDSDAIFFPSDDDRKIYLDVNKIYSEKAPRITPATNTPLFPKVVLAVEAKEVFTNPIPTDEVTRKTDNDKDNIQTTPIPIRDHKETKVTEKANVTQDNLNTNGNVTTVENMKDDIARSNDTQPDLSSRFGDTGGYMFSPINNLPTYQPIQTNPNIQSYPQYTNDQGNIMNPANVGDNPQYIPQNTNANLPQDTNIVPITVSNTYMINGQLYAALTVPNNMNVPNSIYLINPQMSQSGQGASNLPVYNVVQDGYNVNNAQYVPMD